MKKHILGYGELLLRLTPLIRGQMLEQSQSLSMSFAGAEANILCDLSNLGHDTNFISAFPDNPIGKSALKYLRSFGVACSDIHFEQNRMGTYFIEQGASIRGTRVTYDRANSAFANWSIDEEYLNGLIQNSSCLVVTGISPAIAELTHQNVLRAVQLASEKGVKVVFDLNYRRSLWSKEDARKSFEEILPFVDVLIANTGAVADIFGFESSTADEMDHAITQTEDAIRFVNERGDYELVAMTVRLQESASHNVVSGLVNYKGEQIQGPVLAVDIIDRIGTGDAFTAGVIHGMIKDWSAKDIIDFATASFALKHTISDDINLCTEEDILQIARGDIKGYVKR